MENRQHYTIDDLARFSPWPARLLGVEQWEVRRKTPEEVLREYNNDKWGVFLEKVRASSVPLTIDDAERWDMDLPHEALVWHSGRFEPMSYLAANALYVQLVSEALRSCTPAAALVELGCGYGKVVLRLLADSVFGATPWYAADYAQAGVDVVKHLAANGGVDVHTGWCDFTDPALTDMEIPEGAVILTSYATPCVPELSEGFVEALIERRPKAVVHIEPCYEHCDTSTLLGLLRMRYLEVNDYNRNLMTLLRAFRDRGRIAIDREEPTVFGTNPLLSASVIVWHPLQNE